MKRRRREVLHKEGEITGEEGGFRGLKVLDLLHETHLDDDLANTTLHVIVCGFSFDQQGDETKKVHHHLHKHVPRIPHLRHQERHTHVIQSVNPLHLVTHDEHLLFLFCFVFYLSEKEKRKKNEEEVTHKAVDRLATVVGPVKTELFEELQEVGNTIQQL